MTPREEWHLDTKEAEVPVVGAHSKIAIATSAPDLVVSS
jgi:hypothetical protein